MTGVLPGTASAGEEPLWIGGQHRGIQIGAATAQLADRWRDDRPSAVVVQGDTNTALAGALAANSCGIPLVHVEAGLRSGDRDMPEEHNRILIDHLADLCCAPTRGNAANLRAEAIPGHRIAITGNTVVEAVRQTPRDHHAAASILGDLAGRDFTLATIHRPENTDAPARLAAVLNGLASSGLPVLLPLHPADAHASSASSARTPPGRASGPATRRATRRSSPSSSAPASSSPTPAASRKRQRSSAGPSSSCGSRPSAPRPSAPSCGSPHRPATCQGSPPN